MSGALFGKKGQNTADKRLNSIQITQAAYGNPVPLVYGKTRLAGSLIWYNNFVATPHTQTQGGKGGGGSSSTSYTYSAAIMMSLCEGPITSISTTYVDKGLDSSLANQNLTLFLGSSGQSVWSYLSTNYPSQAVPYDMTAYVASGAYQMGGSAALPNLSFETVALLSNATYNGDAPVAAVISDYCTDANHGASFPYVATLTGTNSFDDYCYAMGFFLSPAETTQRTASEFLNEIFQITNSAAVWKAGTLSVVPYGDATVTGNGRTYTPQNGNGSGIATPIYSFTDSDYLDTGDDPVKVSRKPGSQVFNRVRVEYLNRDNQYNTDIAEASDAQDIALNGERTASTYTFHSITSASMARMVAQLLLNRGLYYRNQYTFKVRADYSLLEPMDVVAITDSALGLSAQLVRVVEVLDDQSDELTVTAEELPIGPGNAPQYAWAGAAGFIANTKASPGSVSAPAIFTLPSLLVSGNGGYEIGIAVAGTGALWGGCDVYMSYDNVTYFQIGTVTGPSRYGTLRSSLALNTSVPDTSSTIQLQLVATALSVSSVSQTAVDNLRSLMYVDGEIIAYRDSTLVGTGQYNVSYLRRGRYGSSIASHASAASWAMLDQSLFRAPFDPGMSGKTAYFKFPSFNVYGQGAESLASATVYSRVLGTSAQPLSTTFSATMVNVSQVGNSYVKSGGSAGWGDAQLYSNEGYTSGAYVSAQAFELTQQLMFGLNSDPTTDANYTSIDYAWFLASGTAYIYESGGTTGTSYGTYTANAVFSVTWDGQTVRYLKDGVVQKTTAATPAKLYLDSSFNGVGCGLRNLSFGPMGSIGTTGANAKLLYLISDRQLITYDGTGTASPNVQTTAVSAISQNLSSTTLTVSMTDSNGTTLNASTYLSAAGYLGASGNTFTMSGTSITLTQGAFTTARGSSYGVIITVSHADGVSDKVSILKAQDGAAGTNGVRGSKIFYGTASSWVDATADSTITSAGFAKVALDSVTLSSGTFAQTKYWDGSSWILVTSVIDGNLLVSGTVAASKIDSRGLSIKNAAGNIIFEAGNSLGISPYKQGGGNNVLDPAVWTVGSSGTQAAFSALGTSAGGSESIVLASAPDGILRPMWRAVSGSSAGASQEGGWNTTGYPIDATKTYRFTTWIRCSNGTTGQFYLGVSGNTVDDLPSGTQNSNPYFIAQARNTLTAGRWYLLVGYVFPTSTTTQNNQGGVYDGVTGARVSAGTDYRWHTGYTYSGHRCYQYYTSASGTTQDFWGPRVDLCDGSEPTLQELLAMTALSGANPITSSNVSTYIADAAIDNAQIANLNADKINAGTVSTSRLSIDGITLTNDSGNLVIKNLGVSTGKIAANAVSQTAYSVAGAVYIGATGVSYCEVTITTQGDAVLLFLYPLGTSASGNHSLRRSGTSLLSWNNLSSQKPTVFVDTPSAGTYTYAIYDDTGYYGTTPGGAIIVATELKK